MIRLLEIVVLASTLTVLAGCGGPEEPPVWEKLKIGDLAPTGPGKQAQSQALRMINFDVITFEMPAGKTGSLEESWSSLNSEVFRFNDPNAFAANSFRIGAGPVRVLETTFTLLRAAGGRRTATTSLLIPNAGSETINLTRIGTKTSISFISGTQLPEQVDIGPGYLGLQISAGRLSDSASMCSVQMLPLFFPSTQGLPPRLAERVRANQVRFTPLQVQLKMRRGDFVLLAPRQHAGDPSTLCGLFFGKGSNKRIFRAYLLICTSFTW